MLLVNNPSDTYFYKYSYYTPAKPKPKPPVKMTLTALEAATLKERREKEAQAEKDIATFQSVHRANPDAPAVSHSDWLGYRPYTPRLWTREEIETVIYQNRPKKRGFFGRIGWLVFGD
jgi:hypothetical protein